MIVSRPIKPWTELPPPRHLLEEDAEDEDASIDKVKLPIINLTFHNADHIENLIVAPSTLQSLFTNIGKTEEIGHIKVEYPSVDEQVSNLYDEDIQLYGNEHTQQLKPPLDLKLYQIKSASIIFLTIPLLTDPLISNLIAAQLIPKISYTRLISVSIDNNLDLPHYLSTDTKKIQLPLLTPPNYITGPISSFISKSVILNKKTISLVTNDGLNSLMDICHALKSVLLLQDPKYLDKCYKSLSYGSSTAGLYV